jgi:hypothetical protein
MKATTTTESPTLFNVQAAADYLKKIGGKTATVPFIRGLINRGLLPYTRIGTAFYVSKADIDTWLVEKTKRVRP